MSDYDYQQAVMDDDGAGSAITSTPRERYLDAILRRQSRCLQDGAALSYQFRAAGWVWQCTASPEHVVVA